MTNVEIVPFEYAHLDQMMEIEIRVFTAPWTRRSYEDLAPLDTISIWVAKEDEEVVGYMLYQFVGEEMELHTIAVKPEKQGMGIATMLMDRMMVHVDEMGTKRIFLLVRPSNMPARHLYEKYGFQVIGVRQHYYRDNNENALVMALAVDAGDFVNE